MSASEPHEEKIDLSYLHQMASGNTQFMAEVLEMYLHESSILIEEMHCLASNNEMEMLAKKAHKIKSSTKVIGAVEMYRLFYELEQSARKEALTQTQTLFARVEEKFEGLKDIVLFEIERLRAAIRA
jgi:HPt (histidine-containing phosphotransfer) domain-containing protein